jgi:hypothetical protein
MNGCSRVLPVCNALTHEVLPVCNALTHQSLRCAAMPAAAQLAAGPARHTDGSPATHGAAPHPPWEVATRIAMMCLVRRQSSGSAARAAASGAAHRPAVESAAAGTNEAAQGHPAALTGDVARTPAASGVGLGLHPPDAAGAARAVIAAAVAVVGTLAAAAAMAPGAAGMSHVTGVGTCLLLIGHRSAADHLPAAGKTLSRSCRVQWGGLAGGQLQ